MTSWNGIYTDRGVRDREIRLLIARHKRDPERKDAWAMFGNCLILVTKDEDGQDGVQVTEATIDRFGKTYRS